MSSVRLTGEKRPAEHVAAACQSYRTDCHTVFRETAACWENWKDTGRREVVDRREGRRRIIEDNNSGKGRGGGKRR
eukprot:761583-Hanusia_phi.AAC.5